MATNDFIINITGEINETETRRRIQEALARIVPNATINIQTTGTTQAVNDIDNVSRAIGTTAAVSVEAVRQIENVMKKLIDTTEQLDKSLTNIRIATTDTFENTLSIVKELSANGQELGATTAEMSSGVETWLRQGKTLEQAQALTEETIKFSKVSKKSAEDSAKYLTERLQKELVKLAEVQPEKLIESLGELKETLTDKTQVSSVNNLISGLERLAELDISSGEDSAKIAQQQMEKNIKLIDTEIDKIKDKKKAQEDYVKQLQKEKSELEDIVSGYKTAADTAINAIEDEISALEKRKPAIEDSYSAQIKAINETYDKQKELIKSQQETFDKQIQAIRDEADEQDKLNRLKEKENALDKAKSTKQRVYTEHGFEIQADSEAVAKAQKEYDETLRDYENDNKIKSLESEKEKLQEEITRLDKERQSKITLIEEQREKELQALLEQIQAMEEYKTAWTDAVNAYTNGQDDMTAAALLGSNWREDIANKDIGVLNTFSANYQGALSQLHDVIEPQITQAEAIVTAYDNEITKQNEIKSTQEKYLDFYKTYSSEFAKATDEQREAVEKLNKAIQSNSESGLLSSLLQSAENSFNGDSNSLIDRLAENYNKNPSFYESILGGAKSLIGTASKNLADSITEMGKNILQNVKNDNRTSNVSNNWTSNNPVFDDSKSYEQFKAFANRFIGELNQEAQIGKK